MDFNYKESRQARIERTLAGTGPLFQIGNLLAVMKEGRTLAQRLAEGAEIEREALDFQYPLPEQFRLSLQSIRIWGCPFCGTAHGSGFGISRAVNVANLESNQFYYNPATQQLFTISATCLRKQSGLAERFVDLPLQDKARSSLPAINHQMVNSNYSRQKSDWVRKPIAFMVACYCGLVIYSRLLLRDKNT